MLCPLEMHQLAVATVQCWVVLTWLLMHVIVTWVVILLRLLAPRIQRFLDLDPRPTSMVVLVIRERACEADLVMVHARHPVALPAGMDTAAEVATYTHSPAAAVLRLAKAQAICLANELHLRYSTTCLMYTATGRANASSQSATRVGPHCCRRLAGADSWSDYLTATLPRKALANISISGIPTYSRRTSRVVQSVEERRSCISTDLSESFVGQSCGRLAIPVTFRRVQRSDARPRRGLRAEQQYF